MTHAERIAILEERLDLMVDVVQAQQDQIDQLQRVEHPTLAAWKTSIRDQCRELADS